jgi:succinoglycan biosynthesis transport protein ExoP
MPRIEMNLADYLRVISKRKLIVILSFALVILSTIYYTGKQTPVYRTSCKVKIEQRKSVAEILTELITWSPGDTMVSQANLIKSYFIMEKVAEKLGKIKPIEVEGNRDDPKVQDIMNKERNKPERMAIIKGIQAQIDAEQVENANIITITAVSNNPEDARNLANTVAEVYADTHFENKKREAVKVKEFVEEQLASYLIQLQEAEAALRNFRRANPLIVERDILSVPPVESDPKVESLTGETVKLELELISLKSKYTDRHPQVIILKQKLNKVKKDLSDTMTRLIAQQKELTAKEITLAQLKRNVVMAEEIYSMFKQKYEEARILEAEKARDVEIIESASKPSRPIKPTVISNITIGILSGLLIGLIMAFVTESFDTTISSIDDIEKLLKIPVFGIIPNTGLEKGKMRFFKWLKIGKREPEKGISLERLVTLFEPSSVVAEAYRTLRTNLELIGLKKFGNSIVITSAAPQEGKTMTLCNLGIAMAQAGQRVLLVGSDFRKPMIYKLFGLEKSPGISDVLLGVLPWREAVNSTTDMLIGDLEYERILHSRGIENLNIMTCGERPPNPAELLNFPEMDKLIQELKENYDIVLFDSAPILPVTDAAILGSKSDGVILVYQAGKTSRYAVLRAKTQLENVNVKILGVVINNIKARYIQDVTPYQRYRYYGHHGEKRP